MSEMVVEKLKKRFSASVLDSYSFRDENTVIIKKEDLVVVCRYLKSDPDLSFDFLSCFFLLFILSFVSLFLFSVTTKRCSI